MSIRLFLLRLMIFVIVPAVLFAQVRKAEFKVHDRGNLWETMKDDGTIGATDPTDRYETYPSMDWPGGPHDLIKDEQRSYLFSSGIWIGGKKSDSSVFFTENGPLGYVDPDGSYEPMTLTENFIGSLSYDPDKAEQIIEANWTTSENIRCKRISKTWSFRNHNNFIIMEYGFTNDNVAAVSDVYFGFVYLIRPSYQDYVVHNGWDDSDNLVDEIVGYDTSRTMLYAYDYKPSEDLGWDVGNYWEEYGEIRTTGYAGYALLSADPASNSSPQPSNVQYIQLIDNFQNLTLFSTQKENLYSILSGSDQSLQYDENSTISPFMLMACGPYNLQPGETVKINMVEAVNGLPIEKALEGSSAQEDLPAGLDSLRNSVDRATTLFNDNYQFPHYAPPAPEVEMLANPQAKSIVLTWNGVEDSWTNPLSGKQNASEYIVYRSDRSYIGPYQKVRRRKQIRIRHEDDLEKWYDADLNQWRYEDDVELGVGYYYTITTMDSSGRESWITNRNEKAILATSLPDSVLSNVKVFPNPFKEVSGFPTIGQENLIVWMNLPEKCRIRIYTSSGELVRTLVHDNPLSGEETWDQTSDARQRTAPGIYFWTVESDVGYAKGTLLIIK